MREWWWWFKDVQGEWWFVPSALAILALVIAAIWGIRLAKNRLVARLMSPRMKGTEAQVESQWATPEDLEKFGLVKPKRGMVAWLRCLKTAKF